MLLRSQKPGHLWFAIIIHNFSRSVIKTFSLSDPGLKSNAPQSVAITHLNPAKDLRDVLLATLVRQNKAKGVILISSYLSSDSHFCLRALRHWWPFLPFTFTFHFHFPPTPSCLQDALSFFPSWIEPPRVVCPEHQVWGNVSRPEDNRHKEQVSKWVGGGLCILSLQWGCNREGERGGEEGGGGG